MGAMLLIFLSLITTVHTLGIVDMLMEHSVGIAKDRHGCHVLQECFRKYANEQSILRSFLDNLLSDVVNLASHAYGHIMDYIVELSMDKYGSHFMETCIKQSTKLDLDQIIYRLMDRNCFLDVLRDAFGNYVAQRAIVTAREVKANTYYDLRNQIMSMYSFLCRDLFGEWVLGTLKHPRKMRLRGNKGRFVYF